MKRVLISLITLTLSLSVVGCSNKSVHSSLKNLKESSQVDCYTNDIVVSVGGVVDTPLGVGLQVDVENNSDYKVVVQCDKIKVGGKEESPLFNLEVEKNSKGTKSLTLMGLKSSDISKGVEGIFSVNSIDFRREFGKHTVKID